MIQSGFEILGREFPKALIETLQMMAISMAVSAVFGLLLGFVLFLTSSPLFFRNRFVNAVSGAVVNVIRSIPFVILMVFCLPLAKALVGTKIGPLAASVPLSIAAVAFQARLVEGALREVDQGVLSHEYGSRSLTLAIHFFALYFVQLRIAKVKERLPYSCDRTP